MADPNTQIDWWIAQAWQEAQGGADSDALVAWLHENGLTAVSSFTILQAALSCSSEEAKKMVFEHPAWAGAEAEADLSAAEYTSDTLEPEPEPDATFGLDDWADEIEEDEPVYGEPGYEPPPTATPSRPAAQDGDAPPQRSMLLDAYAEIAEEEPAGDMPGMAAPEQPLAEASNLQEGYGTEAEESPVFDAEEIQPGAEFEPATAMEPETDDLLEAADSDEGEPEIDADQIFDLEEEWDTEPAPTKPAPMGSMVPTASTAPRPEPASPPAAEPAEEAPSPAAAVEGIPEPTAPPAPAAPPPILRMPPATPAERAATFAAAFGKKPAGSPRQPSESGGVSAEADNGGPPSNDTGPAAQAETAPAHNAPVSPQPAPVAAPMPQPLELEPLPEITAPLPVAPAEPLFTAPSSREPVAAPPLFPTTPDRPADPDQPEERAAGEPSVPDPEAEPEIENLAQNGEAAGMDDVLAEAGLAEAEGDIAPEPATDSPATMHALDMGSDAVATSPGQEALVEDGSDNSPPPEEDELPAMDWEEELPDFEIEEPEGPVDPAESDGDGDGDEGIDHDGDYPPLQEGQSRPRKSLLLDPAEEQPHASGAEDRPEDLAEAAKKLGIDFRGADTGEADTDPEISKAAKELGISFRDEDGAPVAPDDEVALEAQKLGISFREESVTGKPAKPLAVKYLPMILGVIVIFFLLLIGATFSGTIIESLKN
jgi:hypothetical protein